MFQTSRSRLHGHWPEGAIAPWIGSKDGQTHRSIRSQREGTNDPKLERLQGFEATRLRGFKAATRVSEDDKAWRAFSSDFDLHHHRLTTCEIFRQSNS